MLITRKNEQGFIYAYFEWSIVDHKGTPSDLGNFMYVKDIWVHPNYNGHSVIDDFIKELDEDKRNKNILWIYWTRIKRNEKVSKSFRRATALRRIKWAVQK